MTENNEKYVQINIGRGELPNYVWSKFEEATVLALRQSIRGESDAVIEVHEGTGTWQSVGIEDSTHISIVADVDTYALRTKLTELKKTYNQDTIALIVGADLI